MLSGLVIFGKFWEFFLELFFGLKDKDKNEKKLMTFALPYDIIVKNIYI